MKRLLLAMLMYVPSIANAQDGKDKNLPPIVRLAKGDSVAIALVVAQGEAALPELVRIMAEDKVADPSHVIIAIADIAANIGSKAKIATPEMCNAMKNRDRAIAATAARALGSIGADAVPDVIKTLDALDGNRQAEYPIRALRHIGPAAKIAVPRLLHMLKENRDLKIRIACIEAIGAMGPSGKATADELLRFLTNNNKSPCFTHVILALGGLGADAKVAIPFLTELLDKSSEAHLRFHALDALSKIGPDTAELNDRIAKMLELPDISKLSLLIALGRGGPLSSEALKRIEETLRDRDPMVRLHGAMAYGKHHCDHPAVVSILIEALRDNSSAGVRKFAAETLGAIRPSDDAVIDALKIGRNDGDSEVRQAAIDALAKFKANGRP